MRYAEIQEFEVNNGEGVGCSLFVQGCNFHCKNCFNQSAWDFKGGKEFTFDVKQKFLDIVSLPYIKRVSILGGEPLADENVYGVYSLLSHIKGTYNKKIWLYTGYTWEYLYKEQKYTNRYPSIQYEQYSNIIHRGLIIPLVDVLIDGQFIDELKDLTLPFRGSSNQRLIDVKKTIERGEIIEYKINNN